MPRDKTGHFYFSWFPTIYGADTAHLSLQEDGAYRRLIDHYMTTRASLPDNDSALARIIGIGLDEWKIIQASVKQYFKPDPNRTGYLLHSFCYELLQKDAERIAFAKANGAKGGRNKQLNNKQKNPTLTQQEPSTLAKQNYPNQERGKDKDYPLTPSKSVDNSVNHVKKLSKSFKNKDNIGSGSVAQRQNPFNILDHLDKIDISAVHAFLPSGWEFDNLVRKYNRWIIEQKIPPDDPINAFSAWLRKYTKGRPPENKKR